jgi:hypothetical protein
MDDWWAVKRMSVFSSIFFTLEFIIFSSFHLIIFYTMSRVGNNYMTWLS